MLAFVAASGPKKSRVVDVGCGYGSNLRALVSRGYDAVGVEINPVIVKANVIAGLPCLSVEEFSRSPDTYDVVLMSHIIEHLPPHELLTFIDGYLDRLRVGGQLVIATPLLSSNFYDDFDHVRPYQPMGLQMAFGPGEAQIQYYSRNKLLLRDVWFRRSPWRVRYHRARYVFGPTTRFLQAIDLACALLWRLSGGLLGRTDGWVGRFEKTG